MTTREKFVSRFGESDAVKIEHAAKSHRENEGDNPIAALAVLVFGAQPQTADDQFLLDIATCISWECLTRFRDDHGIETGADELRDWILENAVPPQNLRDPAGTPMYTKYLGECNG